MSDPIVFGTPAANELVRPHLEMCPFCGSGALIERIGNGFLNHWVQCDECGAHGPARRNAEQARASWNERKAPQYR